MYRKSSRLFHFRGNPQIRNKGRRFLAKQLTIAHAAAHMLLLLVFLSACNSSTPSEESQKSKKNASAPQLTTFYFVRHAEKKQTDQDDPELNRKGKKRSVAIAEMMKEADIDAVYSTPYKRSIATVEPLSDTLDIAITEYDAEEDLRTVVKTLLQDNKGKRVVIVGHSTTIPGMLNILQKEQHYEPLNKGEHDDLFQVIFSDKNFVTINHLKNATFLKQQNDKP